MPLQKSQEINPEMLYIHQRKISACFAVIKRSAGLHALTTKSEFTTLFSTYATIYNFV